ncbi:histone deacetylase [Streptomyces tateyamensis]|uniref:Histone deacetylase n=1 Tax=Streptomyces tateyamensis TaxID=565073 RepID=A0A2V4NXU3_9ACTN|nr:histone deacetylase [Streptomyces tateyamensis]PYC85474.1 histone deacetylase [Streptomyces tateyamensis]
MPTVNWATQHGFQPPGGPGVPELLWYAAYGSNLHLARLTAYLAGGRPPGGSVEFPPYPGCRDRRPPRADRPVHLPGQLFFALESRVWGGGMAFLDPAAPGRIPARAYLVTADQFADLASQEMHRPPGEQLDLAPVLATGRARYGEGRYETLVSPGWLAGHPVVTFTAPWPVARAALNPPAARYLQHLGSGLHESHGWPPPHTARYLATRPGAAGHWTVERVAQLLAAQPASRPASPSRTTSSP